MNKCVLMGRLTRDVELRYSTGENSVAVARFGIAVDRRGRDAGTDFINCVSFGKTGEFIDKYFHKGNRIAVSGRIQTGSYTNKEGQKVYTTDIVVEEAEFCESKAAAEQSKPAQWTNLQMPQQNGEGFMDVSGADVDGLPFD